VSFDLAVWYPDKRLTNDEAGERYSQLCEGNVQGLRPNPAVDAFYQELTAMHPEIDDVPDDRVDDTDYCPWSIAFDRSDAHLIICSVWSKAEYVGDLIVSLARKHGLAVYSPQANSVVYPSDDAQM